MYHAINPSQKEAGYLHVHLHDFKMQMQWLSSNGYTTITIDELLSNENDSSTSPNKKIVLSFDDGYQSLFTLATPVLKQYGFKATLFVTTAAIGANNYQVLPHFNSALPAGDKPLSWNELKQMEQEGWDIQPHGHQHLVHNMIPHTDLQEEIKESKHLVELHLNKQTQYYAFPYGRYNYQCLQLLPHLGFRAAFSVQPGLTGKTADFRLPRIEINRFDTIPSFERKIKTGYQSTGQHIRSFFLSLIFRYPRLKDWLKQVRDRCLR